MRKFLTAQETEVFVAAQKLIVVSNRLPVSVSKEDGKLVFSPSSGGLATAMASLDDDSTERLWIGWPGVCSDELTSAEKATITRKLRAQNCQPVFLTRDQVNKFYVGYANDTLWPLFHYFQSLANFDTAYWQAYETVNAIYKRAVIRHADADSLIWVHDYHLMLLPQMLRSVLPSSTIGFFLHIPFPSYEIFRSLPNRSQILEGLLGADLIGFHIYDYARHFLSSVQRILGVSNSHGLIALGDRTIQADAFPIGIDYQKFVKALDSPEVKEAKATLQQHYQGQKIILSVDRLDYSKGIPQRLEAFEYFLQHNPRYHKKIALVVVAVPSRTDVEAYQDLRTSIEQTISRINGTFGTVDWTPISYQFRNLPFEETLAMFARAEIALLTPLRDGMNLVAKEYVTAKQKGGGVLILSEMAGVVDELPEALRINPHDIRSIAAAIQKALRMPMSEQRTRLQSMQARLSRYTVQRWAADFTDQLKKVRHSQGSLGKNVMPSDAEHKLISHFKKADQRLLLLDYDGTLREFASSHNPNQAKPGPALMALLRDLTNIPNTQICIISGRPRQALESWFGSLPIALAAEHGAWIKRDGQWAQQDSSMNGHRQIILPIMESYADRTPGAQIEQKDFSLVWHYRNVPSELAYARNAGLRHELNQALADTDISIHDGSKIIEVKPNNIHKGAVARDLLAQFPADFVLCIGDDYTDEDMFKALPDHAYSLKVGSGDTQASAQIASVKHVRAFLAKLTK
jgi:trehalose 6-phosphate synthase/phosphatase